MASSHNFERVYGPDSLKVMTTAFDYAHRVFQRRCKKMTGRSAG